MAAEWGRYALILGMLVTLWQIVVPLFAVARQQSTLQRVALSAAKTQFLLVGVAFFALMFCFVTNDFSVVYVAQHSNTHMPWIYRAAAVWGAHEGSMLLWLWILTGWMSALSVFNGRLPLSVTACVLSVLAMIALGFYLFLLTSSDPFHRQWIAIPDNGASLNPILQDPGLIAHPPFLYMGYVGFAVAYAFAMTALISGKLDASWARYARPWTIMAWCFLTVGIVLGSGWAYRELGWGGFWFWDPVENASLLPWLTATALIHSLQVTEKRDAFKAWTVLLAITTFALSLLGTFLVRSGVLISVHAFAEDPARGATLLLYLTWVVGGSLGLYAWRAAILSRPYNLEWMSRETLLLANNIILFCAMLVVLLGTVYPLLMATLNLATLSVGPPYFNTVLLPFVLLLAFLMGFAPVLNWQGLRAVRPWRFYAGFAVVVLVMFVVMIVGYRSMAVLILGLLAALWILSNHLLKWRELWRYKNVAMLLAHCGFALFLAGLTLTTTFSRQDNQRLQVGDKVSFAGAVFYLANLSRIQGENYQAYQADVEVFQRGRQVATLLPQLRLYPDAAMTVSKTAITANVWRDWYVALGHVLPDGAFSVRLIYRPFVRWIWWGGLLMAMAGLLAIFKRPFISIPKESIHVIT